MLKIIALDIFWYYGINTFACGLYCINVTLYYLLVVIYSQLKMLLCYRSYPYLFHSMTEHSPIW